MTDATNDIALDAQMRLLRKRVRTLLIERWGLLGGSIGTLVGSLFVLLSPIVTELLDYRLWFGTVLFGILVGCVVGALKRLDDMAVAISADGRTGLKERISTALALSRSTTLRDMEKSLISDATEHISTFRPCEVFPHKFGRQHAVFAGTLFLFILCMLLPQMYSLQSRTRRQEVAVMKEQGNQMVKVAKRMNQAAGPKREEYKRLAARLDQLGKKMQTGRMDKKTAMLKTQRLSKEIEREQDRIAKSNAKSMEQAQAEMKKSGEQLARKTAEAIAKAEKIPFDAAMKKIPSDKRLAELASKNGTLTESEQAELERAIEKYADQQNESQIPSELGEALAKLAGNKDYQKAMELAQKLAQKLNTGKMSDIDKKALQQQLEALAKSLKGTDLDQLAKQMRQNAEKLAKMSPEQLQDMLKQMKQQQEMAKALEQAGGT